MIVLHQLRRENTVLSMLRIAWDIMLSIGSVIGSRYEQIRLLTSWREKDGQTPWNSLKWTWVRKNDTWGEGNIGGSHIEVIASIRFNAILKWREHALTISRKQIWLCCYQGKSWEDVHGTRRTDDLIRRDKKKTLAVVITVFDHIIHSGGQDSVIVLRVSDG